jgi:ubiquinone/menaquinone biosynthesis C-methylase UbiE
MPVTTNNQGADYQPDKQAPWHHAWVAVDQTSDPDWFVRFLDATRAKKLKKAEADPHTYFAYLDVREGHHVLELGCGTGDFLGPLARLVGASGRIVGLDNSETMIREARRRVEGSGLPIEFCVGDAHDLDFAPNTFNRCYANTLFQHLSDPRKALSEVIRVTQLGGRIAITDQDWETQIIAADDHIVTRKIMNFFCDSIPNGWMGRYLPGLFREFGLHNIVIAPATFTSTDFSWTEQTLGLRTMVERAQKAGAVSMDEGEAWLSDLETRSRQGRFFASFTAFRVQGDKPYPVYL